MLNMMHEGRPESPTAPHVDIIALKGSEQFPTLRDASVH